MSHIRSVRAINEHRSHWIVDTLPHAPEIEWDADDLNMMTDPVVIEYATEKTSNPWVSIAERIPNSRRYVWEVPDKTPFVGWVTTA